MPPTFLFVATFAVWLAAKGRLADYWAFATTRAAATETTTGVPSAPSSSGSAPLLKPLAALPPLTGSSISGAPSFYNNSSAFPYVGGN